MRYNRDTESTARTVEKLDAFKDHKPAQPYSQAEIEEFERALIGSGW